MIKSEVIIVQGGLPPGEQTSAGCLHRCWEGRQRSPALQKQTQTCWRAKQEGSSSRDEQGDVFVIHASAERKEDLPALPAPKLPFLNKLPFSAPKISSFSPVWCRAVQDTKPHTRGCHKSFQQLLSPNLQDFFFVCFFI